MLPWAVVPQAERSHCAPPRADAARRDIHTKQVRRSLQSCTGSIPTSQGVGSRSRCRVTARGGTVRSLVRVGATFTHSAKHVTPGQPSCLSLPRRSMDERARFPPCGAPPAARLGCHDGTLTSVRTFLDGARWISNRNGQDQALRSARAGRPADPRARDNVVPSTHIAVVAVRAAVDAGVWGVLATSLVAPQMQNRRSARWLPAVSVCAPVGIRTPNLLIRSQMLYPLSYRRPPCRRGEPPQDWSRIADAVWHDEITAAGGNGPDGSVDPGM